MKVILFELITMFVTSGGLGFINYFILCKKGTIDITVEDKEEKKFALIIFSIINVLLIMIIDEFIIWFSWFGDIHVWITILITLIVSIFLSFTFFDCMIKLLYKIINNFRKKDNLGEVNEKTVIKNLLDVNSVLFVYLYDLETENLITYGCMGWINDRKDTDFEIEITPTDLIESLDFLKASEMAKKIDNASVYINFDKKIKMVIMPEAKE